MTLVYCGQIVRWIKMKLGMPVDLGPGHIALDWNPAELPSSKRGRSPQFSTHICCGQMAGMRWMDQDATWQGSRPHPKRHCVRWGPSSPSPKGGRGPQFSTRVYCGQTAGWIKMPLGRQVGLSPSDIVLDGDPAPLSERGQSPPIFDPYLLWPNGWMDQDATW